MTTVGKTVTDVSAGGATVTVRVAFLVTPEYTAEIVGVACAPTTRVVTVNVAVVKPGLTVTLDGTVAAVVTVLESETERPPAGAGEESVTVPVDGVPPGTLVGESVRFVSVGGGGVTVSTAVFVSPPYVAVIVGVALAPIASVVTLKVFDEEPAATVTVE